MVNSEETTTHIFILAGAHKQASEYARTQRLHPSNWAFFNRAEKLRGVRRGYPFVRVGTWYELKEGKEIELMIKAREMVEVTDVRIKDR